MRVSPESDRAGGPRSPRTCPRRRRAPRLLARLLMALGTAAAPAWADEPPAAQPPTGALGGSEQPGVRLAAPPPGTPAPPETPPASLPTPDRQPPAEPKAEIRAEPLDENVHGIGLSLSFSTGAGFSYRRLWGPASVQLSTFAVITDRGNSTLLAVGGLYAYRVHTWHGAARSMLPATSALRVLGGLNYFLNRDVRNTTVPQGNGCNERNGCPAIVTTNSYFFNGGAGIGFEFGAINRPGVAMTLDVVLTGSIRNGDFYFFLPLPQLAVLYNW